VIEEIIDRPAAAAISWCGCRYRRRGGRRARSRSELAELRIRIVVEAEFVAERFGIERPALDKRGVGVGAVAAKVRNLLLLESERDLQVMPGTASWIESAIIS
jgi:hypothetical protein